MNVELILADETDAEELHRIQYQAFLPLYEKYHDDETNPVKESVEDIRNKIAQENSDFYKIIADGKTVGGIRIITKKKMRENLSGTGTGTQKEKFHAEYRRISPVFILPEFQNQGIGQIVIRKIFDQYKGTITWQLDTIQQEAGNCHLYEKIGFVSTGKTKKINDVMTLIQYEKSKSNTIV